MQYGAVIVENRKINIPEIVERHKRFLPSDWKIMHLKYDFIKTTNDYNNLLTSVEFWQSLPFDKILIFQHDSGLLRTGIEEFLQYDYVGAPFPSDWTFTDGKGGNGGLSLRGRDAMIKTIQNIPFDKKRDVNEDLYFSKYIDKFWKLAPREISGEFSIEGVFVECDKKAGICTQLYGTLGYHAIEKYLTQDEIDAVMTQYWYK